MLLAHALIIAMASVNGDTKYKSYKEGKALKQPVKDILIHSDVDLTNGGGFKELEQFQNYLSDNENILYHGLKPDRVLFSGNSLSNKKLYLLYDSGHYNVITNLKGAMAKKYICNACNTLFDFTHKCDKACYLCKATQTCNKDRTNYYATCYRWFVSEKCFHNHLTHKVKGKLICQWRQFCRNCSFTVTGDNRHE